MCNFDLRAVAMRLADAYQKQPKKGWEAFLSLMKLTVLDIGRAIDTV